MGAQILLYGYGLVCLSMLGFNLFYALYLRAGDRRLGRRVAALRKRVEAQRRALLQGQPLDGRHLAWMRRRLSRVNGLLAFDRLLDDLDDGTALSQAYIRQLQPVFLYLATVYSKREDTQAAYFCHFLARHQLQRHMQMDQMQQVLLGFLRRGSLYCRVNALKALCAFGSPEALAEALAILGLPQGAQLHEKVISEALLAYTGDAEAFIRLLWARLEHYPLRIQRAVLDYIRFRSGAWREPMREILLDPRRDKELRFSAIRYFGRYPDPAARQALLGFVREDDPLRWEYAAISASSLARYPGPETVAALMGAMHSPNWYVRLNASGSLEALGISYEEMLRAAGGDRYAREMLTYRLESRRLREQAAPAQPQAGGKVVATV